MGIQETWWTGAGVVTGVGAAVGATVTGTSDGAAIGLGVPASAMAHFATSASLAPTHCRQPALIPPVPELTRLASSAAVHPPLALSLLSGMPPAGAVVLPMLLLLRQSVGLASLTLIQAWHAAGTAVRLPVSAMAASVMVHGALASTSLGLPG